MILLKCHKTAIALFVFFACISSAGATSTTWTGTTSSDWNTSTNWDNGAPSSSIDVVIPTSYAGIFAPVLSGTDDALSLTIEIPQTVTVSSGYSLTVAGDLTGFGNLDLSGASGTVSVGGNINISGITPGTSSNVILNGASNQNIGANTFDNLVCNNGAILTDNIVINGNLTGSGSLTAGNYQITVEGNMTGITFTCGTSSVILNGTGTQNIDAFTFNNLEADNNSIVLASTETISGNLSGSATLAGVSGGSITLKGNMSVAGYSASTSTVFLSGSSNQTLNQAYSFFDLTLNNNAGATLSSGNVTITDNLTLSAGTISLGSNNLIISPTTGGLTGTFNASNYIKTNGAGILRMSATSGGAIYPVGDDYNPITIADAGAHVFDVSVINSITDKNNSAITNWTVNRTWSITSPSSATITVTTQWNEPSDLASGGQFDNSDAFIAYRDVTNSFSWINFSGSNILAQSNPYTLTAPGTISTTGGDVYNIGVGGGTLSPLPVSLVSFTAQYQYKNVNLNWATASEQNDAYFEVQRSNDVASWASIGQVQGHATSNVYNNYTDIDNMEGVIPSGTFYYRLKQVDFNGAFQYSMIRTVDINNMALTMTVYPNPANNYFNINWVNTEEMTDNIKLVDISGITVYVQSVTGKGAMQQKCDIGMLPSGVYYLQIISSDGKVLTKAVVKN